MWRITVSFYKMVVPWRDRRLHTSSLMYSCPKYNRFYCTYLLGSMVLWCSLQQLLKPRCLTRRGLLPVGRLTPEWSKTLKVGDHGRRYSVLSCRSLHAGLCVCLATVNEVYTYNCMYLIISVQSLLVCMAVSLCAAVLFFPLFNLPWRTEII